MQHPHLLVKEVDTLGGTSTYPNEWSSNNVFVNQKILLDSLRHILQNWIHFLTGVITEKYGGKPKF